MMRVRFLRPLSIIPEADTQYVGAEKGRKVGAVTIPPPGPLSGRESCENSAGLTSLTDKKWGPEVTRKDL